MTTRDTTPTPFRVDIFGPTVAVTPHGRLAGRDFGGVKQRQILELLVLHGSLSKGELADLLWEQNPPVEYVATLESYVCILRRRLDPAASARSSVVLTRSGGYALDFDRVSTDLGRFHTHITAASGAEPVAALAALLAAIDIAEKPLLTDDCYARWAVAARDWIRPRLVDAATRAAEHALALGATGRALSLSTRATDLDPLAEPAWRARMTAHAGNGDLGGALRCHETLRRHLADELGVEPSRDTHDLYLRLLRSDRDPDGEADSLVVALLAAARRLAVDSDPAGRVVQLLNQAERLIGDRPTRRLVATTGPS